MLLTLLDLKGGYNIKQTRSIMASWLIRMFGGKKPFVGGQGNLTPSFSNLTIVA
jgi:hypothetical protein